MEGVKITKIGRNRVKTTTHFCKKNNLYTLPSNSSENLSKIGVLKLVLFELKVSVPLAVMQTQNSKGHQILWVHISKFCLWRIS